MFDDVFGDKDGFDEWVPEELRPWFESKKSSFGIDHFILVNGKIKKVSLMEWALWFEDFETRKIDYTDISDESLYPEGDMISTVFLGLDHGFGETDKPILFETMVFGGKYDNRGWRYASYGEAKQGHWHIVDCIRSGKPPSVDFGQRPWFELFMDMFENEEEEEEEEDENEEENDDE